MRGKTLRADSNENDWKRTSPWPQKSWLVFSIFLQWIARSEVIETLVVFCGHMHCTLATCSLSVAIQRFIAIRASGVRQAVGKTMKVARTLSWTSTISYELKEYDLFDFLFVSLARGTFLSQLTSGCFVGQSTASRITGRMLLVSLLLWDDVALFSADEDVDDDLTCVDSRTHEAADPLLYLWATGCGEIRSHPTSVRRWSSGSATPAQTHVRINRRMTAYTSADGWPTCGRFMYRGDAACYRASGGAPASRLLTTCGCHDNIPYAAPGGRLTGWWRQRDGWCPLVCRSTVCFRTPFNR